MTTANKSAVLPKLLDSAKAIETAIAGIANRGKKLDNDIQLCGLSVMAHIEKHGDVTLANKLYGCMPAGSRRRALAEWLMAYGKLSANNDRTTSREAPFVYDKAKKTDLAAASGEPWYTFAPEPEVADMFDVRRALHMLLQRAKRSNKVTDMDMLVRLQQVEDAAPPMPADATTSQRAPATTH